MERDGTAAWDGCAPAWRLGKGLLLSGSAKSGRIRRNKRMKMEARRGGVGGAEMITLMDNPDSGARIKVIGAGGCGGNAVSLT